jgi:beta-lactamase class A
MPSALIVLCGGVFIYSGKSSAASAQFLLKMLTDPSLPAEERVNLNIKNALGTWILRIGL